jgi:ketosteroid isomerase-like protein
VDRFLAALRNGDLQALLDVLAPDVVVIADGGGVGGAARHPIRGAERVARYISSGVARVAEFEAKAVWLNGSRGGPIDIGGHVNAALSLVVENGRITRIYAIANPHKLARLEKTAALTRN